MVGEECEIWILLMGELYNEARLHEGAPGRVGVLIRRIAVKIDTNKFRDIEVSGAKV